MEFREIVEKYRMGTASEEEIRLIREEMEKQECLNELLCEDVEDSLEQWGTALHETRRSLHESGAAGDPGEGEAAAQVEAERFARMIQKAIRRAFFKAGAVILALTAALTLFLCYGLSPIVDALYYDPTEEVVLSEGEGFRISKDRLAIDSGVYTELNYPLCRFDGATVVERGFGEYSFELLQGYIPMGLSSDRLSGQISRGVLTLFDANILPRMAVNEFANYEESGAVNTYQRREWNEYWKDEIHGRVAKMGEDDRTIAYVSFDHILSFEELLTLKEETDTWMAWNLVDTHGLRNDGEGWSSVRGGQFGYWDAYGFRSEGEFFRDGEGGVIPGAEPTVRVLPEGMSYEEYQRNEELQTAKMIELLEYMGQQEKFLAMMGEDPAWYRDAAEYVGQHGMRFMGIAVYGSRETLQKLLDHPLVSMVTLEQE